MGGHVAGNRLQTSSDVSDTCDDDDDKDDLRLCHQSFSVFIIKFLKVPFKHGHTTVLLPLCLLVLINLLRSLGCQYCCLYQLVNVINLLCKNLCSHESRATPTSIFGIFLVAASGFEILLLLPRVRVTLAAPFTRDLHHNQWDLANSVARNQCKPCNRVECHAASPAATGGSRAAIFTM